MKKILAAAIAATLVAPAAFAGDNVVVYGIVHNSVDFTDSSVNGDAIDVADRDSRLGFKGSEDLGNGLKALFQFEMQINTADLGAGWGGGRNSYVGLAGDFGTVVVGRHDTPLKMSTGKLNVFADQLADYKNFAGMEDVRAGDAIAYISPNFSGLTLMGATVVGGQDGVAGEEDNIAAGYSLAAKYSNGGLFAALAYEDKEDHIAGSDELWRVGLGYSMDAFHVGLVYEEAETAGSDTDKLYIGGKYSMGNNVLKAAWANIDNGSDTDAWAIGVDHNFSKRTMAYVQYADSEHGLRGENTSGDTDGFSIGMKHKF